LKIRSVHLPTSTSSDPKALSASGTKRAALYTEFDGHRPKRLVIKVLGE
jgi:hypothetical protein